ncbi:F-box protein [Quillaja saponaria]|uniref:F-box protein n=1 Tax=Quillaja saponaria TaxID=32244 RepID=A0AAD7PAU5_QUISA|nr:F-box protein [Quillaja saponaria]
MEGKRKRMTTMLTPKKRRKSAAADGGGGVSDWCSIPDDILCLIASKIGLIEDYVRFCAVCRSWYLIATNYYNEKKKFDFGPLLMLREKEEYEDDAHVRRFYSHASRDNFVVDLPEAMGRRCWGSAFGWLVTFCDTDLEFNLLNPFTRAAIPLPRLRTLIKFHIEDPQQYFIKAFLTSSPDSPDCLLLVVITPSRKQFNSILGFAKPGRDKVWSTIKDGRTDFNDIISFKGNLYGCPNDFDNETVVFLIQTEARRTVVLSAPQLICDCDGDDSNSLLINDKRDLKVDEPGRGLFIKKYLVDLEGELCLVLRYVAFLQSTVYFKIFKIDMSTKKWTRVWPLGDQCLFVGNNYTFTCKATLSD